MFTQFKHIILLFYNFQLSAVESEKGRLLGQNSELEQRVSSLQSEMAEKQSEAEEQIEQLNKEKVNICHFSCIYI